MKRLLLLILFFSIGCATKRDLRDTSETTSMAVYEGKLAVILPTKTHQLSFEFFAHPNKLNGRLDLRALLGISAATLWMSESSFTFLNHIKKEAYFGQNTQQGLKAWINIDLDPNIFFLVMTEKKLPGWNCQKSQSDELQECSRDSTRVQFERVSQTRKKVTLINPSAEIRFIIEVPASYKPMDSKVFLPVSPKDYKIFTQP